MGKLNLKSMLQNYERTLCDKIFCYELNDRQNIKLIFYRENFCHLAGLHHVYDENKRYLGAKGYDLIVKEKLTIGALKNTTPKGLTT